MAKAAGKMGWTQDEFLFSTPSFFFAAFEGHIEQEEQRTAITLHGSRVVAYYAIAPHIRKGKRINLREIIELPNENAKPKFAPISQQELDDFSAAADAIVLKNMNNGSNN